MWRQKGDGELVVTYKEDQSPARQRIPMSLGSDFRRFSDSKIILQSYVVDPPDVWYHGIVGFPYGGTYITSDNFSAQKIRYQNGVTIFTGSTRTE